MIGNPRSLFDGVDVKPNIIEISMILFNILREMT